MKPEESFEQLLQQTNKATGVAAATFTPPLCGHESLNATQILYSGTPQQPEFIVCREVLGSEPPITLGVGFSLSASEQEISIGNAFGIVDNGLHIGHSLVVEGLSWSPGEHLRFGFNFIFNFAGQDYQVSNGLLDISYLAS